MKHITFTRTPGALLATVLLLASAGLALPLQQHGTSPASSAQEPAGAQWKRYRYEVENFSVEFPAEPQAKPNPSNTGTRHIASLENENFAYLVEKAELPLDLKKTPEQVFADYITGAAKGTSAEIKNQRAVSLIGYPGREFVLESEVLSMKLRLYLVGKSLYQVLVVASKNVASRAAADRFLDSFELLQ